MEPCSNMEKVDPQSTFNDGRMNLSKKALENSDQDNEGKLSIIFSRMEHHPYFANMSSI